jgi:transcriptional regulator NrdR family protein
MASSRIGELVMEGLKALDPVAYIRFASVYKDFREARISSISRARRGQEVGLPRLLSSAHPE